MTTVNCIDVVRVRGTVEGVTSEEVISGELEFVPNKDGTAFLMLPVTELIERNEEGRKRGLFEVTPMSKLDLHHRVVLNLGRRDSYNLLSAPVGTELTFKRLGWGRVWNHRVVKN